MTLLIWMFAAFISQSGLVGDDFFHFSNNPELASVFIALLIITLIGDIRRAFG